VRCAVCVDREAETCIANEYGDGVEIFGMFGGVGLYITYALWIRMWLFAEVSAERGGEKQRRPLALAWSWPSSESGSWFCPEGAFAKWKWNRKWQRGGRGGK
jgi:hypothetical protein